jgi:hypothetical protein
LFRFWIFAAGEGDAEFVRFLFLPLEVEDVPLVFDEAGEGVGVSRTVRSSCVMMFGMLALSNDRLNVASELKLILPSTFP